jgi:hypothetical protein
VEGPRDRQPSMRQLTVAEAPTRPDSARESANVAHRPRFRRTLAAVVTAVGVALIIATITSVVSFVARSRAGSGPEGGVSAEPTGTPYPYDLYVHCGVQYTQFRGRWWHATPEKIAPPILPDEHGMYVYTGFVSGTMTLVATDLARFVSSDGRMTADFQPMSTRPPPCD